MRQNIVQGKVAIMFHTLTKGIVVFILLAAAYVLSFLQAEGFVPLSSSLLTQFRWFGLVMLCAWGIRRNSLTAWIMISMLVGAEIGHDWPAIGAHGRLFSLIFLKMIKTIVAPLIFSTLVVGIAGHGDIAQVGRMGLKSIIYFEIVTTLALFIGLGAINLSQAGVGIDMSKMEKIEVPQVKKQSATEIILHCFPENVAKSVAEGQVLQIVVFSVFFAIALAMCPPGPRKTMLSFCESLSEVMFKFTKLVMYLAPLGVGGAIAQTVGHMGLGVLTNLFKLLLTLYGALFVFILVVLLPIALIARIPIRRFVELIAEPVSISFATTSSEAALPTAMKSMEELGVPPQIVAFVMPTGYSFNLDGTTLYLALASVFVAQAAGIQMSWGDQLLMVFTLMLTSKGVAGVPRASLVILLGTAASFNLPVEPIFIILGIDELMDMARTSVNVIGNCLATAVIARWEGQLPDKPLHLAASPEE